MTFDPVKMLLKPRRLVTVGVVVFLVIYLGFTSVLYFTTVVPSFRNESTSDLFAVDSTLYMYFADSVREGHADPWVFASLAHFPNTLWMPVAISYIFTNPFWVMGLNYLLFSISILILKKIYPISLPVFLFFLILNPTTTTSILCVNKEVIDIVAISGFLYALKRGSPLVMLSVLLLALLNRWEICVLLITFLVIRSFINPVRRHRWLTLLLMILILDVVMPRFASEVLADRFQEAQYGNTITLLDQLQIHYLYVVAVVPKIAENLFGFLINSEVLKVHSSWLLIFFFNNLADAILIAVAAKARLLTLQSDLVYLAAIGAVIVAQSLAVQPRYFYFAYVLLCVQVSQLNTRQLLGRLAFGRRERGRREIAGWTAEEAAVGGIS